MKTKFSGILTLLLAFVVQLTFAQEKTISGTISDNSGLPLPGATVLVKGTTTGTSSDFDGNYSIKANQGATLVISFVGYTTKEIKVATSNTISVQLSESAQALEEVVISTVGIKRAAKSLGYSTQNLDSDEIVNNKEANLVNSLSGKIAGVQITNSSGAVGSSSRIVLRGASSIFGDNQPLFIVDGVPISNSNTGTATDGGGFDLPNGAADINPNDIETLNVLKGPSAAAIYGVRAANGVIIITTKKGKQKEALGIEINSSISFQNPLVLPKFQNSYGQGTNDYFEYINGSGPYAGTDESWGPPLDVGLKFLQFTSYINNPSNPQPEPWVSHPNNIKDFYETGLTLDNNISLSSGHENGSFRLGMGYSKQTGMIPFTDFEKFNISALGTQNFKDKITANYSVKYIKSDSGNLPNGGYDGSNPVQQTIWSGRNVDFNALKDWRNLPLALPGSVFGEGLVPTNWNTRFQNNPYWQLETNRNEFSRNRLIGTVGLSSELNDMFTLSGNLGVDYYVTKTNTRQAKGSAADSPAYSLGYNFTRSAADGYYDENQRTFMESNIDLLLSFKKDISDDFKVEANIGGSRMHRTSTFDYRATLLELPNLFNLTNVKSGGTLLNRNTHSQQAINSIYGSAQFSFRDYLFLNVTGRNDWASVLSLDNDSFFYPSVNLSAIITDMLDIKSSTLNYLKVRGGWAQVGGFGPLAPSDIITTYDLGTAPWAGTTFGSYPTVLKNPNLQTQKMVGYEAGFDLRMFNNKLRLNATAYDQTSSDLVIQVAVPRPSGVTSVWDNVGELNNKGIEIELGTTLYTNSSNDFSIDLDLNYATNNNQVVKAGKDDLNNDETIILGGQWNMNIEAREGHPYGTIYGPSLARTSTGQVIFENGLPKIGDNKVLGDIQPDFTGGANLSIRYKNLTFSTLVDTKIGGDVYSMSYTWGRTAGVLEETLIGRETGIVGDGVMSDGNGGYVPNNVVRTAKEFNQNSFDNNIVETSVFDASYVKLRQMSLGYALPKRFTSAIGIDGLNFSVIGRNLAILYKNAPHIDPETGFSNDNGNQGQEFGQLPSARSIAFNISLKF